MGSELREKIVFGTFYDQYVANEIIGAGGAGRVYGGKDSDGNPVAIKLLTAVGSTDKQKRFRNETAFLAKQTHPNLVRVRDAGLLTTGKLAGPFYVMDRYEGSLRDRIERGIPPSEVLGIFSQILDGVEAAHFSGTAHRDLKPENILVHGVDGKLAVADFGIASFTAEELHTLVETSADQRLANFEYSAPEQRRRGETSGVAADIYALGLMLNELFTKRVAHGTGYVTIGSASVEHGFLDPIVAQMLLQSPTDRPGSIRAVKQLIQRHRSEAVSLQRLSKITNTVVEATSVDDFVGKIPSAIIGAEWDKGRLFLTLDKPTNPEWIGALLSMGNFTAVQYAGPEQFHFDGNKARVAVGEHSAQDAIDYFKDWLVKAAAVYRNILVSQAAELDRKRKNDLQIEQRAEELKLRVNKGLRF